MERQEMLDLLNTPEYDFLRTDTHLNGRAMLLVPGGSHSYGTSVDYIDPATGLRYVSDFDLRGVAAEGPNEIIGLSSFEQFENKVTDTTIYSFRKIVSLMLNCNPNTIEVLGVKPEHILYISPEGQLLKDNVDLFLSRRAAQSFGGYATQQLRRLENALARDSYTPSAKEKHILKSLQSNMQHLMEHYEPFAEEAINLYIDKSDREDYDEEIFIDINLKHYPFRDYKNIFSEMGQTLQNFGQLNHRNKKKDDIHLNKHAMHLVRLFIMGEEILCGKGIKTFRDEDRELLLKIRFGEIPYDEVFQMVYDYEKRFQYAKENSPLPSSPNYRQVEEFVMEVNKMLLRKYGVI